MAEQAKGKAKAQAVLPATVVMAPAKVKVPAKAPVKAVLQEASRVVEQAKAKATHPKAAALKVAVVV